MTTSTTLTDEEAYADYLTYEAEAHLRAEMAGERAIESPDPGYYADEMAAGR